MECTSTFGSATALARNMTSLQLVVENLSRALHRSNLRVTVVLLLPLQTRKTVLHAHEIGLQRP